MEIRTQESYGWDGGKTNVNNFHKTNVYNFSQSRSDPDETGKTSATCSCVGPIISMV